MVALVVVFVLALVFRWILDAWEQAVQKELQVRRSEVHWTYNDNRQTHYHVHLTEGAEKNASMGDFTRQFTNRR